MLKPKIFLASSGNSYPLVEWLSDSLSEEAETVEWKTEGFSVGESTLGNLKENCRECDLAVVFLTEDDYASKGGSQGYAARDNCIFEAGLFMGALGLNEQRCILVSSVKGNALPSDLKGVTLLKMPSLGFGKKINADWCSKNLKAVRGKIRKQIRSLGLFRYRPLLNILTRDQLAMLERVGVGGDLKAGESVVVSSVEPVERDDKEFAMHVMDNICANIPYHYFFPASGEGAFRWVQLIRSLVVAGLAKINRKVFNDPPELEDDIKQVLSDNHKDAKETVARLSGVAGAGQGVLRIHLLSPNQHVAMKICVHNATSENAKCYLRHTKGGDYDDYFVQWATGPVVKQIVEDLLELKTLTEYSEMFCSTKSFELYDARGDSDGANTRQAIELAIKTHFPDALQGELAKACLSAVK
jgi:hypothetical protein